MRPALLLWVLLALPLAAQDTAAVRCFHPDTVRAVVGDTITTRCVVRKPGKYWDHVRGPNSLVVYPWKGVWVVDTAATSPPPPDTTTPPPPAPPDTSGSCLRCESWAYPSEADPQFRSYWGYGASGGSNPPDVMTLVDLVPDATFGQVARIQQGPGTALSPQLSASIPGTPHVWVRFRVRFSSGWTAAGSTGPSLGNAYKVAHLYFVGYGSEARTRVDIENSTQWGCGFSVQGLTFTRTGTLAGCGTTKNWGDALTDGSWTEWVMHMQQLSPTSGKVEFWLRRITPSPSGWIYHGGTYTGAPFPIVRNLHLGINRNRVADNLQYVYWGPFEIRDGAKASNPFGVP